MSSFETRAPTMGLTVEENGMIFSYSDIHSSVKYKKLMTVNENVPYLALFAGYNPDDVRFKAILSDKYEFEGNEVINGTVRNNISDANSTIFRENTILNKDYTMMYNEIIIDNCQNLNVGNVYPTFIVVNSYNGTRRKEISFGINISGDNSLGIGLRESLGVISQIHSENHSTSMSGTMGNYVQIINDNINDVVEMNLRNTLDDDSILSTLDFVEKLGKKRRQEVASYLQELSDRSITSWDLFLAVLRYSSKETNLNIKLMLENVAERVLELPTRMINAARNI